MRDESRNRVLHTESLTTQGDLCVRCVVYVRQTNKQTQFFSLLSHYSSTSISIFIHQSVSLSNCLIYLCLYPSISVVFICSSISSIIYLSVHLFDRPVCYPTSVFPPTPRTHGCMVWPPLFSLEYASCRFCCCYSPPY